MKGIPVFLSAFFSSNKKIETIALRKNASIMPDIEFSKPNTGPAAKSTSPSPRPTAFMLTRLMAVSKKPGKRLMIIPNMLSDPDNTDIVE